MKHSASKLNLKKIIDQIDLYDGDKILVSSSLVKILMALKKDRIIFDNNEIIDLLKKKVGRKGTLLFPTYNWDFCKGKNFYYKNTISRTGSLSNLALKRSDFERSRNPIYSFAITGKDKEYLCNLEHENCFGLNSPFGYLLENKGKNLFIGIDYKHGFTFAHVAEEIIGVDYRFYKYFEGRYFDKNNKETKLKTSMYVRHLHLNIMTGIHERLDAILKKENAYSKKVFNGISFIIIDLYKTHKILLEDIQNRGGIIFPKKLLSPSDLDTPIR